MNMEHVLQQLDELFEQQKMVEAEQFLKKMTREAMVEGDVISFATSLLDAGNAYRAAGLLREAMTLFEMVREIYVENLEDSDFLYADLYNNMSFLFREMGDYESACDCLKRALEILTQYREARTEVAVTYTNLAISQLKLMHYEEAIENLCRAFAIFEPEEEKDDYYSCALSAMGEAQYLAGNMEESAYYYERALQEIEKTAGKNQAYEITLQNLGVVQQRLQQLPQENVRFENGMELCESFYEAYGIPMIRSKFPQYEKVIAAGLVGEGSECFGFDDEISRDHDFGPGFCLWVTDQVYDEIGEKLQEAYEQLPDTYMGITRDKTAKAQKRVGVFRIGDFYEQLIGLRDVPTAQSQWLYLKDYQLATAVNGKVFRDDLGEFTRIRKGIQKYYPEDVRIKKIAREAALMAQSGQYNYSRMFGRGEKVTADIALAEFLKHTMAMVYLLNHTYAPFYKWMHRGMEKLPILNEVRNILTALVELPNGDERIPDMIELIVTMIIAEMKKQGLTSGEDNYLDHHTDNILHSIEQREEQGDSFKASLVNELVQMEWQSLMNMQEEESNADRQKDFECFSIMRKSKYYTWNVEMLKSYLHDFHVANDLGRNLMMERRDAFFRLSEQSREIIQEIVKIQLDWTEQFAKHYPKTAERMANTICESGLVGELSTYSDETLDLYGRFVAQLCLEEENLMEMTAANLAFFYGYSSLEELEEKQ